MYHTTPHHTTGLPLAVGRDTVIQPFGEIERCKISLCCQLVFVSPRTKGNPSSFSLVIGVTFVLRIQEVTGWNFDPEARSADGGGAAYD
jgi:hypothetical protein